LRRGARGALGGVELGLRKASGGGVLGGGSSGGVGLGSLVSLVTSLVKGGTTCWSSSGACGVAGSGRVDGLSANGADRRGAEPTDVRARSSVSEEVKWGGSLHRAQAPGDKDAMARGRGDDRR
jgi:hypothetical protein